MLNMSARDHASASRAASFQQQDTSDALEAMNTVKMGAHDHPDEAFTLSHAKVGAS